MLTHVVCRFTRYRIDMPIYKTKAELVKYLTMAISMESTGFGIE
jgi:hypothetical protein